MARITRSIPDTWRNVTTDAADFKELIPEFYDTASKGDFLINFLVGTALCRHGAWNASPTGVFTAASFMLPQCSPRRRRARVVSTSEIRAAAR